MATRPHRRTVVPISGKQGKTRRGNRTRTGQWRPDTNWVSSAGLRLTMRHEPGVTKGEVLLVPLRFQVPLMNNFDRAYQYNWATYETLRQGQKSRPEARQLLTPQFDTMLLDGQTADASSGVVVWSGAADPQRLLTELRWIMGYERRSQPEVFRLVVSQPAVWGQIPLLNMLASLTVAEPVQRAEEVGTEYLNLSFLEFSEDQDVQRKQRPQSHGQKRWKLHRGDTLYEIAKKSHWHRPSAWKMIAKANGITGVAPSSAEDLAAWAKKHHKTELAIPQKGRS